ncbi:MAG: hypothetical protein IT163_13080 [Bryobacterales bacterium]|nr:hypothetical protein [Bryobacterales bacterium]
MTEAPKITDWITAGSAFGAFVSAVWYTVVTRGLLKAQQRQVAIQQEQLDDARCMLAAARKPRLSINLTGGNIHSLNIVVRNDSQTLALLVKLVRPGESTKLLLAESLAPGRDLRFEFPLGEKPSWGSLFVEYSNEFGEHWVDEWRREADQSSSFGCRLVRSNP